MNSEHAPTAEEQLPPLDEGLMDFPQKDNASDVLNQVAIRQCRERQLLAALRENRELRQQVFRPLGDNHHNAAQCPYCNPEYSRNAQQIANYSEAVRVLNEQKLEKDARIAELTRERDHTWTQRNADLFAERNALQAKLRAVSDALKDVPNKEYLEERQAWIMWANKVEPIFARIRAILEAK